ncbi:MAG: hypothetical protein IPJ65_26615 [Archangiaceae bacterium]|nr:hypothetical protein [Archangiaceae bacterium]
MSNTLRGSAVVTAHRDPNKTYVSDRNLANLAKLGVEGDALTVARRGDEILDPAGSMPGTPKADGTLYLYELDRLDKPQNQAVLFPNERAAVPAVHALFEVPDSGPVAIAPLQNLDYRLERTLTNPAVTQANIPSLPTPEQQTAARRLQLVKNGDGNADTISRDDITWGLDPANIGAFTGYTVDALKAIAATFHDDLYAEKVIGVLPPAWQSRELVSASGVKVTVNAGVGFHTQSLRNQGRASYRWSPVMTRQAITVEAPVGYKVFAKVMTTDPAKADPGLAEAVIEGNGAAQEAFTNNALLSGNASVWIQITDPVGAMVRNVRVALPATALPPQQIDAGLAGRKVDVWKDTSGAVIDPQANGDKGILGYSLDGHPHLFARGAISV